MGKVRAETRQAPFRIEPKSSSKRDVPSIDEPFAIRVGVADRGKRLSMTPNEFRAARALTSFGLTYVSKRASVDRSIICRFENDLAIDPKSHMRLLGFFDLHGLRFMSKGIGLETRSFMQGIYQPVAYTVPEHRGMDAPRKVRLG